MPLRITDDEADELCPGLTQRAQGLMLTAKQSAAVLGIPVRTFYDLGLPCYRYGPRCASWAMSDLKEYQAKCRFTSTKPKADGATVSAVALTASVTSLQNSFRKAGAEPKRKPTTDAKVLAFSQKQPG